MKSLRAISVTIGIYNCTLFTSGNETLSTGYKQDTKLGFIVKALYTLAHSLHNMQRDLCGDTSAGVCPAMTPFNGKLYKVSVETENIERQIYLLNKILIF